MVHSPLHSARGKGCVVRQMVGCDGRFMADGIVYAGKAGKESW